MGSPEEMQDIHCNMYSKAVAATTKRTYCSQNNCQINKKNQLEK